MTAAPMHGDDRLADPRADRFAAILERNVDLAAISQWRIGGRARMVLSPRDLDELVALRRWLHETGQCHIVIGATSNLLFADEGLDVPCIRIGEAMAGIAIAGTRIQAGPGVWVPRLARRAQQAGLEGLAHVSGIPGTLGGLICMNGGSQRKGIGSHVTEVVSVDVTGTVLRRAAADCGFAYRTSIFQHNDEIIAGATLELPRADDPRALRREMVEIMASRRRKFPKSEPNCGSVFVSNPAMYAKFGPPGAVIERLGFKGRAEGGALVSPMHANFIVNRGGARARDVLALIALIAATAQAELGVSLLSEVRYVAHDGRIVPATEVPAPGPNP